MARVDERVRKLQGHFALTQKDIEQILTSTDKVTKRGQKIEALEFGAEEARPEVLENPTGRAGNAASSKTGQLRLRVIEDE